MKQNLPRILIGLSILLLFLANTAGLIHLGAIDRIDFALYDARLRATMPRTLNPDIVILDIDEKSIEEVGHWPWGRDKMARIIDKLFDVHKVELVGFDIVWAERDPSSGLAHMDELAKNELRDVPAFQTQLERLRPSLDFDRAFADSLRNRRVVLGYYFTSELGGRTTGTLPEPVLPEGTFKGRPIAFTVWNGYGANLPELQKAAAGAGHFNPIEDDDGNVRRVPMLVEYDHQYYESLSLAVMRTLLGSPGVQPGFPEESWLRRDFSGLVSINLPAPGTNTSVRIPVDRNVTTLVPYRGPGGPTGGSFKYISLSDVLNDRVKPGELTNKIVLIGTTALGLNDMRSTPVNKVYPGVEVHANLIAGMIEGSIRTMPDYALGAEVMSLLVVGLLLAFALPFLSAVRTVILTLIVTILVVGLNLLIFHYGVVLPLAGTLLLILAIFVLDITYGYFVESRSKRELTGLFGSYVPPELVEEMSRNPRDYSMEGRSEDLTVMFADVRGFTTISESLDPKALAEYINEYLTAMSVLIQKSRGTIDKYVGDMVMAFWGAPVADANHAQEAVNTAMAMQAEVLRLSEGFKARGWPVIEIGIGLSTGTMKVGDMGSKIRRAYTVMGDAVNLGSRLESKTKHYGVGILVPEPTKKAVHGIVFREIDRVQVKGKDEPVAIFEPVGLEADVDKSTMDELKLWHQTLKAYRAQQWDQAELQLMNLRRMSPDRGLYKVFLEAIAKWRADPPEANWTGVTKFTDK